MMRNDDDAVPIVGWRNTPNFDIKTQSKFGKGYGYTVGLERDKEKAHNERKET